MQAEQKTTNKDFNSQLSGSAKPYFPQSLQLQKNHLAMPNASNILLQPLNRTKTSTVPQNTFNPYTNLSTMNTYSRSFITSDNSTCAPMPITIATPIKINAAVITEATPAIAAVEEAQTTKTTTTVKT